MCRLFSGCFGPRDRCCCVFLGTLAYFRAVFLCVRFPFFHCQSSLRPGSAFFLARASKILGFLEALAYVSWQRDLGGTWRFVFFLGARLCCNWRLLVSRWRFVGFLVGWSVVGDWMGGSLFRSDGLFVERPWFIGGLRGYGQWRSVGPGCDVLLEGVLAWRWWRLDGYYYIMRWGGG